jgi:hypothetical protein
MDIFDVLCMKNKTTMKPVQIVLRESEGDVGVQWRG